ncbi:SpoIIE family protein phosphatase, partial [Streptomyces diastatochromogenes]|uniref:SpoIIE family protein phosphatase n=1 Tax=Streptomyces diastatochromogenes TaxID=42236 RepID=UPI0036600C09
GPPPPLVAGPRGGRAPPAGAAGPGGPPPRGPPPPPLHRVPLGCAETLLMVTDGVTEARDGAGEFYPLAREVARAVEADPGQAEPRRLVRRVRDGVLRHSGGHLGDDTTVFAVRRAAGEDPVQGRLQS